MNKQMTKILSVMFAFIMIMSVIVIDTDNVSAKASDYAVWSSIFNADYYYNNCADARSYAGKNVDKLWQFFVKVGIPRGDQASEEFNVFIYAKNYPELYKAYGGNMINYYLHYAQAGKAEGRNAKTLLTATNTTVNNATNTVTNTSTDSDDGKSPVMREIDCVNREREANGLAPLQYDPSTQEVADLRAREQVELFGHTRPDGSSCWTAYSGDRFFCGENAAYNHSESPEGVTQQWMNSPGHRANILGNYTYISVGMYKSGSRVYWIQCFFN